MPGTDRFSQPLGQKRTLESIKLLDFLHRGIMDGEVDVYEEIKTDVPSLTLRHHTVHHEFK